MLCDYGCGQEAIYKSKNGKYCCNTFHTKCPNQKKKYSNSGKGKNTWSKGKSPWNKGKFGVYNEETIQKMKSRVITEETKNKISIGNKIPKQTEKFKEEQRQRMLNGQALKMIKCIKKISNEELKLRNLVKELYPNCEFQHPVFRYSIDVAIPEYKIAIEYDGYYHFDTEEHKEYHKQRQEKIENEGWKFLRYTIFDKFPSMEQIKKDIQRLL